LRYEEGKIKNKYKIFDDYVVMYITRKNGDQYEVIFDIEDYDKVSKYHYKWFLVWDNRSKSFFVRATKYLNDNSKKPNEAVFLHRYILDIEDSEVEVDHINHDTLNNRRYNLRVSQRIENSKNRETRNSNNKSGYRNVFFSSKDNCWIVSLRVDGKNKRWYGFKDVHEAGKFAEEMRQKYYKEFAGKN